MESKNETRVPIVWRFRDGLKLGAQLQETICQWRDYCTHFVAPELVVTVWMLKMAWSKMNNNLIVAIASMIHFFSLSINVPSGSRCPLKVKHLSIELEKICELAHKYHTLPGCVLSRFNQHHLCRRSSRHLAWWVYQSNSFRCDYRFDHSRTLYRWITMSPIFIVNFSTTQTKKLIMANPKSNSAPHCSQFQLDRHFRHHRTRFRVLLTRIDRGQVNLSTKWWCTALGKMSEIPNHIYLGCKLNHAPIPSPSLIHWRRLNRLPLPHDTLHGVNWDHVDQAAFM